jgi:hypothetical protein
MQCASDQPHGKGRCEDAVVLDFACLVSIHRPSRILLEGRCQGPQLVLAQEAMRLLQ